MPGTWEKKARDDMARNKKDWEPKEKLEIEPGPVIDWMLAQEQERRAQEDEEPIQPASGSMVLVVILLVIAAAVVLAVLVTRVQLP